MLLIGLERARPADLPRIRALLEAAGLPPEGADRAFEAGVVARLGDEVIGAAAIEAYGSAGLLRSVVVTPDRQAAGLGRRLVAAAEALAHEVGIRDLYLLTETAIDWFPRLGYAVIPRDRAAVAVGQSIEFTTACATTAVAMHRQLG